MKLVNLAQLFKWVQICLMANWSLLGVKISNIQGSLTTSKFTCKSTKYS